MLSEAELKHLRFAGAAAANGAQPPCRPAEPGRGPRAHIEPDPPLGDPPEADELSPSPFLVSVLARAGLDPSRYRSTCLERRLPACLRALRAPDCERAEQWLVERPERLDQVIDALLLGVTGFFRDRGVFDALRNVLPEIAAETNGLRIWSVGCSDGAELYSMALLLGYLGLLERSYLLGTDCRAGCVARAQMGEYDEPLLDQIPPALRGAHIERYTGRFRIADELRKHTQFLVRDFLRDSESGPWDLILWRNSAIYLRARAARDVWQGLAERLRPGGLLVSGKAERPQCAVPLARLGNCLFQRTRACS